jgi:hypothetical protein
MDIFMACSTDHERLAPAHCHQSLPRWCLVPARMVEVCQFADVVDFNALPLTTELTTSCQQPVLCEKGIRGI